MEDMHHFDIDVRLAGFGTTVLMDGKPMKGVRSLRVDCGVDQVSTVTLELVSTAKVTGEAQVWVINADKITEIQGTEETTEETAKEAAQ